MAIKITIENDGAPPSGNDPPTADEATAGRVRLTVYISPELDQRVRREKGRRMFEGLDRAEHSCIVEEALAAFFAQQDVSKRQPKRGK